MDQHIPSSTPIEASTARYNTAPDDALPFHLSDETRRPRQKRWTSRSRTGCLTCRARRIKCDEAQPVCSQCKKAGRSCLAASAPTSLVATPQRYLRPDAWGAIDVNLHQYFITSICSIASDEFNGEFWQRAVLQARTALPAIRYASNAVACMKWTRNPSANLAYRFKRTLEEESVRQYSASTKCILDIIQSPRPSPEEKTTVLLASIFYYRYALDWDSIRAVLTKSCLLIRHWKFWKCLDYGPTSALASQVLYYFIKSERAWEESLCETPAKSGNNSWLTAILSLQKSPLTSTIKASVELEMLWNSARAMMENLPFKPSENHVNAASLERTALYECFKMWEKRFSVLISSPSTESRIQIAVLHVRRALVKLLFKVNLEEFKTLWSETCWDRLESDFANVLGLVESVLAEVDDTTSQASRDVCYTPFLYKTLNFIARFCRNSAIRHKAADIFRVAMPTALARSYQTQLGPYDKSTRIRPLPVDHIIALEESAWERGDIASECSANEKCIRNEFVCNLHRVARVSVTNAPLTPQQFTFSTAADLLQGRPGQKLCVPVTLCF